jgi:hypothetical protein
VQALILLAVILAASLAAAVADGAVEADRDLWAIRAVALCGPLIAATALVDARRARRWLAAGTATTWTVAVLTVPVFGAGLLLMPSAVLLTAAYVRCRRQQAPL